MLGRYELLRPIARGGMATVYLARVRGEGGFERQVAIKLMHPHIAEDREFVAMFLDEARIAARIRHPNVVSTLEVDRGRDGLFLVLELVEGHSLHAILRHAIASKTPIPLDVGVRIALDLLEGLHAAHEVEDETGTPLNLVHRDVSPQNVLVGKDGVARITDFGVAHARSRLATTQGTSLKGKVAYLSPEQLLGNDVDRRSDVFAAGIVIWELLVCGRRLFRGRSEGETVAAILSRAIPVVAELNPAVPKPVSDVVQRALAFDPADRYGTAVEFADALSQALASAGRAAAHSRAVANYLEGLAIPPPAVDTIPNTGTASVAASAEPTAGTGTAGSPIVASVSPAAPRRRWVWPAVAGFSTVVIALGVWVATRGTTAAADPPASANAAPSTPQARAPDTVAPPVVAPSPVDSQEPAAAEPKAVAADRAEPELEKPPTRVTEKGSAPTSTPRPRPTSVKPSATSYRPEEL